MDLSDKEVFSQVSAEYEGVKAVRQLQPVNGKSQGSILIEFHSPEWLDEAFEEDFFEINGNRYKARAIKSHCKSCDSWNHFTHECPQSSVKRSDIHFLVDRPLK